MSNGVLPQPPNPQPLNAWQKIVAAREAWMLQKHQSQHQRVLNGVDATNTLMGQPSQPGATDMPGDISVGDTYTYPTPVVQQKQGISGLGATGIAAAALALGGLAVKAFMPAAAPLVAPVTNAVTQPANPDLSGEGTALRLAK